MSSVSSLNYEMDKLCVEAILLTVFARLHPFEFPLDRRLAIELSVIAQDIEGLSKAIGSATNGAYSEVGLVGQIQQLCAAPSEKPFYTEEQTNGIISIYAAGFDPALASHGILDYSTQYPEHCRNLVCRLFDTILSGILWWFSNPSSSGLPEPQTLTNLNNVWLALVAMCGKKVTLPNDENYVANSVRRWLESDIVAAQSREGGDNTRKLKSVVSSLRAVLK
jgi:hypothetical protein